jgi:hypothetical protein
MLADRRAQAGVLGIEAFRDDDPARDFLDADRVA